MKHIPAALENIFQTLKQNRFEAWLVGGALRDEVIGIPPRDFDVLTNAAVEDLLRIFSHDRIEKVGRSFQVCLVNGIQVSSCRAGTGFPYRDLEKRDFTFNAMAWNPFTGRFIDPFLGRRDIADKVVRFTGSPDMRIDEDPLRMVRACRFVSVIEGRLSKEARAAITAHAALVETRVAKERIHAEIMAAMACKKPSLFFQDLQSTGLLKGIFPSLDRCVTLDGGPHHGETVFDHCLMTGDALPAGRPVLRLAGFLHDTGKYDVAALKEGSLTFPGHEACVEALMSDLETLRFSQAQVARIVSLTKVHMRPLTPETTSKAARRLLAFLFANNISHRDFLRLRIADRKANLAKSPYTLGQIRSRLKILADEMRPDIAFSAAGLKITGHDVMRLLDIGPGPEVGEILNYLVDEVIEDPAKNTRNTLEQIVHEMFSEKGMA